MARESSAIVGSGVSALREAQNVRAMQGTNSVLTNYEDINSCLGIVQSSGLAVDGSVVHLTGPATRLRGRRKVIIQNLGGSDVYIGGADVTTSNGLEIGSGNSLSLDVLDYGHLYIVGAGASDVRILELR